MSTTTISLRLEKAVVDRIDRAAARDGQTRNTYILSWLPVYYDSPAPGAACNTDTADGAELENAR